MYWVGKTQKEMNIYRTEWALSALCTYAAHTGQKLPRDKDEAVSDLLCDLMHFCRAMGVEFDQALEYAQKNYDHESDPKNADCVE